MQASVVFHKRGQNKGEGPLSRKKNTLRFAMLKTPISDKTKMALLSAVGQRSRIEVAGLTQTLPEGP